MRTVFSVDIPISDQAKAAQLQVMTVSTDRSPYNVPLAQRPQQVTLSASSLPNWNNQGAVSIRGQTIRDALRQHQGVAKILDNISTAFGNEIRPIYIKLTEGEAELITWESLCDSDNKFVALDWRWPIGRISDPLNSQSRLPPIFQMPIKVMAIISAFNINSQQVEWKNIFNAVKNARIAGLDVYLKVLVGDEKIRALIETEITNGCNWLEVHHVEATSTEVIKTILAWQPNVVHFFCHGFIDTTSSDQWLELATSVDYLNKYASSGSVKVRTNELKKMSNSLTNPWLITLNCCSTGQASKDLPSMAYATVSEGFPAAIAMLEPVDAQDAHEFTRAFYRELFNKLQQMKIDFSANSRVTFEWAELMFDARKAIHARHINNGNQNCHEWALPVLYVRGVDPIQFERSSMNNIPDEYKIKLNVIAEWLRSVGEETSLEARSKVMEKVLAEIPRQYWPNTNGTFSDG
jgi:CHAT domain